MNIKTTQSSLYNHDGVDFKNNVKSLLLALSEREQYVITHRFAIERDEKETLDKIGQEFSITRERVRQIENNALKKLQRIAERTRSLFINEYARKLIAQNGGVMSERRIIADLLNLFKDPTKIDSSFIRLSLSTDSELIGYGNTISFVPYWRIKSLLKDTVKVVSSSATKILKKRKDVISHDDFLKELYADCKIKNLNEELVFSIMEIDKRVKLMKNEIGLKEWRHIHPRTLRDKIHFVLKENRSPLHFVEISNKIAGASFDHKNINTQAVHNELIRCENFVLIGRGLYALKEWGYEHGTISDIIEEVLREKGKLSRDEIVQEVMKKRKVKRISIIVTLKNKPKFQRIGRDMYTLA